jgi:hypothetical protein
MWTRISVCELILKKSVLTDLKIVKYFYNMGLAGGGGEPKNLIYLYKNGFSLFIP